VQVAGAAQQAHIVELAANPTLDPARLHLALEVPKRFLVMEPVQTMEKPVWDRHLVIAVASMDTVAPRVITVAQAVRLGLVLAQAQRALLPVLQQQYQHQQQCKRLRLLPLSFLALLPLLPAVPLSHQRLRHLHRLHRLRILVATRLAVPLLSLICLGSRLIRVLLPSARRFASRPKGVHSFLLDPGLMAKWEIFAIFLEIPLQTTFGKAPLVDKAVLLLIGMM